MHWWVHDLWASGPSGRVELISWVFWVIFSITLHELAHGWAAIWQGDDTPRRLGHMTMNPLVHMPPMALLMFAIIGITWGLMPVDPSRFRWRRQGRIVVSGAGPAMNLALALVAGILLVAWLRLGPVDTNLFKNLALFLFLGCWLNVVLALFNLIPILPLDGSHILSGMSMKIYQLYQHPNAQFASLFVLVLLFVTNVFDVVLGAAQIGVVVTVETLGGALGSPSLLDQLPF